MRDLVGHQSAEERVRRQVAACVAGGKECGVAGRFGHRDAAAVAVVIAEADAVDQVFGRGEDRDEERLHHRQPAAAERLERLGNRATGGAGKLRRAGLGRDERGVAAQGVRSGRQRRGQGGK